MKKLIYLMLACFTLAACSIDSIDANEDLNSLDAKVKTQETQDPMGFYAGNSGKKKGTIDIWNDCNNLYLQITAIEEDPDEVQIGLFQNLPELNNGGNFKNEPEFYGINDADGLLWTISLSTLNTEADLFVFTKAWSDWAGSEDYGKMQYFTFTFSLEDCDEQCTFGYGYWRNHNPIDNPGEQENMWPELEDDQLQLGNKTYTIAQLVDILNMNKNNGNRLTSLAQHLIAAKLNVLNGADDTAVAQAITDADSIIGDLTVGEDNVPSNPSNGIKDTLESYNEGEIGPGNCEEQEEE